MKIGVFLWCFRNSGAFLQQGCTNTTPTREVSHFYHTPSRTFTRAHTHARYAHTHTHMRRHTRAQAQAHTPRRSRASAFLSPSKSENENESPQRITLSTKRITPNHRKTPAKEKTLNMFSFVFSVLTFLFGKLQKKLLPNGSPRATKAYRNETRKRNALNRNGIASHPTLFRLA